MAWDDRYARHLTHEAEQALRWLQNQAREAPDNGLFRRMEVLMAEKRAAYEARNMERYEAAIQAIVAQAQAVRSRIQNRIPPST